jgi:hypothetical protein
MEVFSEVLELVIVMDMLDLESNHIYSFDIDFHMKKRSKRMFDCEYVYHLSQYFTLLPFILLYPSHYLLI